MTKTRTQWVCQNCGHTTPREMGRCPKCGALLVFTSLLLHGTGPPPILH